MNVIEALQNINSYPIPTQVVVGILDSIGVDGLQDTTQEITSSKLYIQAEAKLYEWLSLAPDINQGGVVISFTDNQRSNFIRQSQSLYNAIGNTKSKGIYGYRGSGL